MAGHASDEEYTPTVFWVKDGQEYKEPVSAYGEVSAGEEEDEEDLYEEDNSGCPSCITIGGDIFQRAYGKLPTLYLYPNNDTAGDVDEQQTDPDDPPNYYIYFNHISDFHNVEVDLDLLLAMIETPRSQVKCRDGHTHVLECRNTYGHWAPMGSCLGEVLEDQCFKKKKEEGGEEEE